MLANVLRFGSALARLPATYPKLLPAIQCDASNVLDRKPNALLKPPEIPKVHTTLPVKLPVIETIMTFAFPAEGAQRIELGFQLAVVKVRSWIECTENRS